MKKHVKFDEGYCLVSQDVNPNATVEVAKSINYLIVVDVSGSMTYDLPEIRKNLKNKISNLIKHDSDTISIIWFSGRNDAGILKEEVHVNSLKQLNDLNDAIDRFLKPISLTAFAKPLELANDVIERINKNNPDSLYFLLFMSDGFNNDTSWENVMNAVKQISPKLSSSLVVEYGWYADSRRLTEMAGTLGGEKISCSGLEEYDMVIGKSFNKTLSGGKKIVIDVTDKYLYDFAFSVGDDGSILVYNIVDNKVTVGNDVKEIHFFSPVAVGEPLMSVNALSDTSLYAAIYLLSDRLLNDDVEKVFYQLGDNFYYKMLANAFGKQKLNTFKNAIKECVADVSKRFPDGRAAIQKVDDNAYCLMNLIEDLGNIDGIQFYPNHPDFNYSRIGRKRVARGENLSEADKKRISEAKNVAEITKITEEIKEKNIEVQFVNSDPDRGYYLTDLVWNEARANLSVRIRIEGKAILPENKFKIDEVATYKYNTFTLIKDGIVNVEKLPVNYSPELETLLHSNNVMFSTDFDNNSSKIMIIDLTSLPIINRGMVRSISATELAKEEYKLLKLQSDKKVYDFYRKSLFPKTSQSYVEMLGQECADWLKLIGITDYNGFAPLVDLEESTDFYMSVNLITKIKGLSSLPKVEDVVTKLKSGKDLKISEWIMSDAIKNYLAVIESDLFKTLPEEQQKDTLKTYLETKSNELNKKRRKALQLISETKFSIILSKKWFKEFKSFDENTLELTIDKQVLNFTFDLTEKEIKI
jgi:Mg-chelatase subunit ChlD